MSHGYAWAKNVNITGIARYLADGWVYRYYQSKLRYKNLFLQAYLNSSFSGESTNPTRNLATGSLIYDRSKKFSLQLQHFIERMNGDFRFVWGIDYFLTLPDTKGTILADKDGSDLRDNNGNGEAGSPNHYFDRNDSFFFETGESFRNLDSSGVSSFDPTAIWNANSPYDEISLGDDNVSGAIKDGLDNDRDSDDFNDLDGNGLPWTDNNGNGLFDPAIDQVEPGARVIKGTRICFADG